MENIFDFIAILKTYLNQKFENDFWIDPKHTPYGTLLLKSITSNKKIIFKPIDSALPIGGKRIHDFIINTPTFKKNSIDNYIIVARKYKENAIKLTESNKQLTLLAVDFGNKNIMLFGSKNIDMDILKSIKAFSNHFDEIVKNTVNNQIDKIVHRDNKTKSHINTERRHRENVDSIFYRCPICNIDLSVPQESKNHDVFCCYHCHGKFKNPKFSQNDKTKYEKIKVKTTEQDYWSDYNKKYPRFKYVLVIALIILFFYIVGKFSTPDPEYDEFIDTRAKMMMLKEKGLATDKDIKQYEDAYYKSRKEK